MTGGKEHKRVSIEDGSPPSFFTQTGNRWVRKVNFIDGGVEPSDCRFPVEDRLYANLTIDSSARLFQFLANRNGVNHGKA
jgi:hypothetical protein